MLTHSQGTVEVGQTLAVAVGAVQDALAILSAVRNILPDADRERKTS